MEKEYNMEVAQTIKSQLFGTSQLNVLMSWGIENFIATEYKEMPALTFKVNGRLFSGNVLIALNGSDYYEIYLFNENGCKCICEEACFDEMVDIIDENIEKGKDIEEYNKFCGQQLANL